MNVHTDSALYIYTYRTGLLGTDHSSVGIDILPFSYWSDKDMRSARAQRAEPCATIHQCAERPPPPPPPTPRGRPKVRSVKTKNKNTCYLIMKK